MVFKTFILLLLPLGVFAQTNIRGTITDLEGPVAGANVYLKDTYDGTSTNENGQFSFSTKNTGEQFLIISSLVHQKVEIPVTLNGEELVVNKVLRISINELTAVSITAGSIEASDEKRSVVLKPFDIVTTSGAMGGVVGALNTLPGTATVANDGRLFVRGGDASETSILLDGLRVGNAYGTSPQGVPTRSRFNPFILKGTFFSTGGYSAEYGQALSSVLVLNTVDMPERSQTDLSLMTVGGSLTQTLVGKKQSVTASLSYIDLEPYQAVVPQNFDWKRAPHSANAEVLYRYKTKNGIVKGYFTHQFSALDLYQKQLNDSGRGQRIQIKNNYNLGSLSFQEMKGAKWMLDGGSSFATNHDDYKIDTLNPGRSHRLLNVKLKATNYLTHSFSVKLGAENVNETYRESLSAPKLTRDYQQNILSAFAEGTYYFNEKLVLRSGVRSAYDNLSAAVTIAPRVSAAYQVSKNAQLSLAYGRYYQSAKSGELIINPNLDQSYSTHYIFNYQYAIEGHTLRAEVFYKKYGNLITGTEEFSNDGAGRAAGIDLFYRDKKSIKNLDFWISYSYTDSKRKYLGFTEQVQPSYAPKNNFSIVGKYWIGAAKSQAGATFSFNDGYPFDDPNKEGQQESKTIAYSSLNFSWSYLPRQNIIIHAEVANVLGRQNVFGYQFSGTPDSQGIYTATPSLQGATRFIFLGVFITLSKDKNANQLNNL